MPIDALSVQHAYQAPMSLRADGQPVWTGVTTRHHVWTDAHRCEAMEHAIDDQPTDTTMVAGACTMRQRTAEAEPGR
jgi:hypothetical protein